MTRNKTLATVAVVTGLLAALVSQSAAQADTNAGNNTTLAAVGSDTSQDVMEGLSIVAKDASNNPLISNYRSIPVGRTITTRTADSDCVFTVPRSSGEGVNALSAAMRGATFSGGGATTPVTSPNMTGCVDIARSSSGGNPTVSPGVNSITYIPFATDSISFATTATSEIPHKLNFNTIKAYYTANGTPGSTQCFGRAPLLPSFGSGTRQYFGQNMLGLTDAALGSGTANSWGSCVRDTNSAGTPIQEHDGRFLTAGNQLVPFSVSQFISQQSATITDIRGRATLGAIDFGASGTAAAISPVALQTTFGSGTRPLYNAVASSALGDPRVAEALVGTGSDVCQATATLQQYGLASLGAGCGTTTKTNTN